MVDDFASILTGHEFPFIILSDKPCVAGARSFGDSGFKEKYRDGSNQVQHFALYFGLGFHWTGASVVAVAAGRDADEPQDVNLGYDAGSIGFRFALCIIPMEQLGNTIRKEIGGK